MIIKSVALLFTNGGKIVQEITDMKKQLAKLQEAIAGFRGSL